MVIANSGNVGAVYGADCSGGYPSGFEFPIGAQNWLGGGYDLWIGGIRGQDTLVSTGWAFYTTLELWPAAVPSGTIRERTTRGVLSRGGSCQDILHDDSAISEHDVIANYNDTLADVSYTGVDPYEGRGHLPLGIEIEQTSYSWSFAYAQDFVIVLYKITNSGVPQPGRDTKTTPLKDLYVGLLGHNGAFHYDGPFLDSADELDDGYVGFLTSAPVPLHPELSVPVAEVWCADNDGDPVGGSFTDGSTVDVGGLRVLWRPGNRGGISFNWWAYTFDGNPSRDWGPVRRTSHVDFVTGGLGTPWTDRTKYR